MELLPSSRFSLEELADLFTRGYEGYALPFAIAALGGVVGGRQREMRLG